VGFRKSRKITGESDGRGITRKGWARDERAFTESMSRLTEFDRVGRKVISHGVLKEGEAKPEAQRMYTYLDNFKQLLWAVDTANRQLMKELNYK